MEFLSQLRPHCDPSLHPIIDEILEHLLKLPHLLFPSALGHAHKSAMPNGMQPPTDVTVLCGVTDKQTCRLWDMGTLGFSRQTLVP